jgi:hypothetical protein
MMHILSDVSAYAEGKLDAELARKGLVSESTNPYPQGSLDAREYERGARDAQPRSQIVIRYGDHAMMVEV